MYRTAANVQCSVVHVTIGCVGEMNLNLFVNCMSSFCKLLFVFQNLGGLGEDFDFLIFCGIRCNDFFLILFVNNSPRKTIA